MREIKFRAWHKNSKKMLTVEVLPLDGGSPVWHEESIISCSSGSHCKHSSIKDLELMQYTGLKDKFGVRIYEGDVVRHCYTPPEIPPSYSVFGVGWDYVLLRDIQICPENYEVIGNIYENPELLGTKKV